MSETCCESCDVPSSGTTGGRITGAERWQTLSIAISGLLIGAGAWLGYGGFVGAGAGAYVAAAMLSIGKPLSRARRAITERRLDINVLMVIAVVGAAALGDWFEAATVVWLFGIAQWLESWSMGRARHAIKSLMSLAPSRAVVRRGTEEREVAVADVVPGDVVVVRPGERIPVDARVRAGESDVNQAPVTGESWPA